MKKQKRLSNRKVNKKRNAVVSGPIGAFCLTFGIVLGLGIVCLFLWRGLDKKGMEEAKAVLYAEQESAFGADSPADGSKVQKSEGQKGGVQLTWEDIPQMQPETAGREEREESEQEQKPEESRYGAVLQNPDYMRENRIIPWEGNQEDVVTLGFVGDILFDDEYAVMASLINRGGTIEKGISQEMLALLQGVDILAANNEFPYTKRGTATEGKTYTFRAQPETAAYLHDMGVDVAVLANNHMFDFGEEGLLDTLDTLSNAGIPYIGAGRNLKEASAPVYFIANDIKIAFVAATQIERLDHPDTRGAGENLSGVFRCWNPEKLYEVVAEAKANSDFVVVYMHWGTENEAEPDWAQLEQAPGLAEAGADLIIGDHPHCLQGIAYHGDVPVIYSLGNFWFNSKTVDTGMVQVEIDKEGLKSFRFVPAVQSDCKVSLVYGAEKERILSYMRELSPGVKIDSEGFVSRQ